MKDDGDRCEPGSGPDARRDRLKLALRENLKRRKAQARGRSDAATSSSRHDGAALDGADDEAPGR